MLIGMMFFFVCRRVHPADKDIVVTRHPITAAGSKSAPVRRRGSPRHYFPRKEPRSRMAGTDGLKRKRKRKEQV